MAFQPGNNFWEMRSTHGREKLFNDHNALWEAACEYFKWCIDNPLYKAERGAANEIIKVPLTRPFTMHGLCNYLDCGVHYFKQFTAPNDDFSAVIRRINETVYMQKFEGAAVGYFNANIIARDLGLADKKEIVVPKEEIDLTELSDADLAALDKAISKMKHEH